VRDGSAVGADADAGLVGRERELASLGRAWEAARGGQARIVGVDGDPAIGKTALLRRFVTVADPPALVWVSGDEDEAALPWGVLSQIARAMPGSRTAAAAGSWDERADPIYLGQALAADLQESKDLLLVVDDAHWGDRPSMVAVRLAARRLFSDPVMVVVVHRSAGDAWQAGHRRPPPELDDGWRRLIESDRGVRIAVTGLSPTELVRLAAGCGHPGLPPGGAFRLYEHTGGHPLQVRHLLDQLPMHSIVYGHGPLPAPRAMAAAVMSRLAACQPPTRDLLAAGALIGRRFSLAGVRALTGNPSSADAVAEAVAARLVEEVPGSAGQQLSFTSTLVRGLIYHDLGPARRRELHGRAAALGRTDSTWHRIAAASGPDQDLAAEVERAARDRLARGELSLAAAYLRHALDLTPAGPARVPRLLTAVEAMLVAGDLASTMEYETELAAAGPGGWPDYVYGYQLLLAGRIDAARARLASAFPVAHAPEPAPPDLPARIATQLAIIAVLELTYPEMIEYGAAAVATAREPWVASFAWFARSLGLAVAGRGTEALAELAGADAPGAPSGLDGLVARGMIRLWTDDLAGAYHDLTAVVERASRGEALRIGQAMAFLGETEYRRGALGESVLHTDVAVGDAHENHRVWDYAMVHALASYPLAAQARWEPAEAHAEQATRWARQVGTPAGRVYAAAGRAALAQARDDPGRLLVAAEELETVYPAREPGTHLVGPLRADALSRLGRAEDARRALAAFTERLPAIERASTRLGIARVRAQIAAAAGDHREALRLCRHAGELAREVGLPLEAARIDLLAGGYHGAVGQRAAAERSLLAALRRFSELGATAYVDQTLRAAGQAGLSMAGPPAALDALTPAERAVVTLACQGLSNREIAARLVLSVKTIEFHLTNAYRRLDVATRDELRRVVTDR
jgi:DNA-binding NarL/FixJ family response regulator